ncbi:carotenoid biosynthesis protein [Pleurocapsales cyanobacterium LEGE 06147]|nr:carotenoid biosynthesis protein [Pleurocapsales cyanobacterium LEGE 06147]
MKPLISANKQNYIQKFMFYLLIGHILSMAFGLAGILLVLPNQDFMAKLSEFPWGQTAFSWSMAGGGVVYMVLGMAAVAVYAYRTLGIWHWLAFMLPAIFVSLGSELLGTSTGFPFGHYRYLSGLGYKIAGLVPFTIPLSWFYLGLSTYIIARAGLESIKIKSWLAKIAAIAFGALLLTSWDFVLDPAMSQTHLPFWIWEQPGAFFGMPYQNFVGWMGTGIVFMTIATLLWQVKPLNLSRARLGLPVAIYLSNFAFATILSLAAGIYLPVLLGIVLGIIPVLVFSWMALAGSASSENSFDSEVVPLVTAKVPVVK